MVSAEDLSIDITKLPTSLLKSIPAGTPPPGTKSNFVNPHSRGPESQIVIYIMLPVMMIFLFLRLYVRVRVQKSPGSDDCLAIVSALCVAGYCGILIYLVDGPGGEHMWDIPLIRITASIMKANLSAQCLYALASIFTKSTLLILYLRLFAPSKRAVLLIWAGLAIVVVSHVAICVAQVKVLVPKPGASWFKTARGSSVQNKATKIVAAQGIISIVTDFYVLCVPMSSVWALQLPKARKVGVAAIFGTGLIACVCSVVGTVFRFRIRHTEDIFWDSVPVYILTVVELNAGIICSCMPVLPILLKRVAKSESYRKSSSVLRYLRIRRTATESSEEKMSGSGESNAFQKIQIAVPKPTMTGLRTFIRGGNRSQLQPNVRNESFAQLDSVDDYHHALRQHI